MDASALIETIRELVISDIFTDEKKLERIARLLQAAHNAEYTQEEVAFNGFYGKPIC